MTLTGLSLQHFRSHGAKTILFSEPTTVIVAPNASGKTNILEALHLLSTGESFRAGTVDDFIQVGQEYGRIKAKIRADDEDVEVELLLTTGSVAGKQSAKRIFLLNGVKKQRAASVGVLRVVSFIPEDLRLITGSPARRRSFLNDLISQLDREYIHALTTYDQTLKRRNKLLQLIRDGRSPVTTLSYYNAALIKHGEYIQEARRRIIDRCMSIPFPIQFSLQYTPSVMSAQRLEKYASAEQAVGHTLIGPHKDDFMVHFSVQSSHNNPHPTVDNLHPLSTHGSRGQQRMGVLWLKICSFHLLSLEYNSPPILLLDDIFSELDDINRSLVLDLVAKTQTILTSAERDVLEIKELQDAQVIQLDEMGTSN